MLVKFYDEPRLFWITVVAALDFIINAAGVQQYALLERQLRYVAVTAIDRCAQLFSVITVAIAMACDGLWLLGTRAAAIVAPTVGTLCAWSITGWVPGFPRRGVGVRSMLLFGATATLNGLVVYAAYNLEKVLLGRFWGADALGLYGRAYQLINVPTENLNSAVGGVAFSALSRLQDDPVRFRNYFLKGYSLGQLNNDPYHHFLCAVCRRHRSLGSRTKMDRRGTDLSFASTNDLSVWHDQSIGLAAYSRLGCRYEA